MECREMLSKCHILFIFLTFGFVLNPKASYGCGTRQCKSENTCCNNGKYSGKVKKVCCQKNNQNEKDKKDGCGGTCGHRSCSCTSAQITFIIPYNNIIKNKSNLFILKKQRFANIEIQLPIGFYSIWIPPKII